MSNSGLMSTLNGQGFEPDCPYFREHKKGVHEVKLFRVHNLCKDSQILTVDSFGDRRYIDVAEERPCSQECGCRTLDTHPESSVFTFVTNMTTDSLQLQVHSASLRLWLCNALPSEAAKDEAAGNDTFYGLQLLKHRRSLMRSMKSLSHPRDAHIEDDMLIAEARLLVDGLLSDPEFFFDFGYENLYEQGYLTYEDWEAFQGITLDQDLGVLEDSIDSLDLVELHEQQQQCQHERSTENNSDPVDKGFRPKSAAVICESLGCSTVSISSQLTTFTSPDPPAAPEVIRHVLIRCQYHHGNLATSISSQLTMFTSPNQRAALEDQLGCPENSLITAAKEGDLSRVKAILELAAELKSQADEPTGPLIDINAIRVCRLQITENWRENSEITALMAATYGQHHHVAKYLIEEGADVNVVTKSGTALSLAHGYGDRFNEARRIGQLLLQNGADFHVALVMVRQFGWDPTVLNELAKAQAACSHHSARRSKDSLVAGIRARRMLRQLHSYFSEEHQIIIEGLSGLSVEIEEFWKDAWRTGIRALRNLCNGIPPKTVNDTIMFLAVARAMSRCIQTQDPDYQENFLQDIGRWQLVFNSEDGSLSEFKIAAFYIWGIQLDDCEPLSMADSDATRSLQDMVKELCCRATSVLSLGDVVQDGFLTTKQRWWSHAQPSNTVYQDDNMNASITSFQLHDDNGPRLALSSVPSIPEYTGSPQYGGETENYPSVSVSGEHSPAKNQILATFLMAGTIFITIISFLLIALRCVGYLDLSLPSSSTSIRAQLYQPVATHALDHILSATAICLHVDNEWFAEARTKTLTAIQNGLISTYTQLGEFLSRQDVFKSEAYSQQLRHMLNLWHSTFLAQETYTLLSQYLGSVKYRSIVPYRPFPTNELQEPSISINDKSDAAMETDDSPTISLPLPPLSTPAIASNTTPESTQSPRTPKRAKVSRTYCEDCKRDFGQVCNYNKHRRDKHEKVRFVCRRGCGKNFSRNAYRMTHERKCTLGID